MIKPNQLGRSPFPASASQWMLVGLRGGAVVTPPFDPNSVAGLLLWLKADSLALADGSPVSTWSDSSTNGNNATAAGTARLTFKTGIVNGLPILRTNVANTTLMDLTTNISSASPWTILVVFNAAAATDLYSIFASGGAVVGPTQTSDGHLAINDRSGIANVGNSWTGAFHVFTGLSRAGVPPAVWVDGALQTVVNVSQSVFLNFSQLGYGTGDIAEILFYSAALSITDRQNVEGYLKTKYATP